MCYYYIPVLASSCFCYRGESMVVPNCQLLLLLVSMTSFFCVCPVSSKLKEEPANLEEEATVTEPKRGLNVLLIAVPAAGHMAPSLGLGEELVRRGHRVTFLTTTDPTNEKKIMEKVKVRGMTYVSAGESIAIGLLGAKAKTFKQEPGVFTLLQRALSAAPQESAILGKFLDQFLARNSVDIMVGEEVLESLLQCIGTQRNVKTVILSTTLQFQPHTAPRSPWPGLTAGSVSDNLTFRHRLRVTLTEAAFQFFYKNILGRFTFNSIRAYCPNVMTLSRATGAAGIYMPQIVPTVIGFEYPRSVSPLTTYVGPILPRNPDPISADLQEWLDTKEEKSVVYVSMGSHVILTKEQGTALLNGILSTNYSLLWSLRESNRGILDGVQIDSERVRLLKWAPQLAVLGHRAVGVAIVHGGANSVHESLYNEVPLIVMPSGWDQMANAGRVHHQGLGIHLQHFNVTESSVFEAIKRIDAGAYRKNIQRLKKSFNDGGGRERAAELIEFYADVGYSHLVPAYAKYNWSWVQYYNVDVYLILTLFSIFMFHLTVKCCRCACKSLLCRRFSREKKD